MAIKAPDLVKVTTSTSGSGTYTYSEAVIQNGYRSFTQAVADGDLANGDQVSIEVRDSTAPGSLNLFERLIGTIDIFAKTITKDFVYQSSGGGAVTWGAGTRDLYTVNPPLDIIALLNQTNMFTLRQLIRVTGSLLTVSSAAALLLQNSNSATECYLVVAGADNRSSQIMLTSPTYGETGGVRIVGFGSGSATPGNLQFWTVGAHRYQWNHATGALETAAGAKYDAFPSGTALWFKNTSAPTGWVKSTVDNDAALRVVSGTPGASGGSLGLSSAVTGVHQLSTAEMPAHAHDVSYDSTPAVTGGGSGFVWRVSSLGASSGSDAATSKGGDGTHSHPLALKYADGLVAVKS